jgi:hypothetical protein
MTPNKGLTPHHLAADETSMDMPSPEVRALLDHWADLDPRLKYPFMSESEFLKMQRERAPQDIGSEED